ncbi:MAG TPA: hypothetical protein VGY56_13325 [Verrucomicrobiae bacterium]|nr:hypothetical protein [Verrucomicrobiae bacterium]
MSLTYHYAFTAPGNTPAGQLEDFLHDVEDEANAMGFDPVLVIDAAFDTPERQRFARQLTTGARIESEKLKGVVPLKPGQVWNHDNVNGSCRIIPKQAVVMVVTNEDRSEVVFGFLKYPDSLVGTNGKEVVETGLGERWTFQSFVNSPDERYRKIVERFAKAGYLESAKDEFRD